MIDALSLRELEVLYLVAEGKKSKDIATELYISINTVNWHIRMIYQKLQISSRVEATRIVLLSKRSN